MKKLPLTLLSLFWFTLCFGQEYAKIVKRDTEYIIYSADEVDIIDNVVIQINEKKGNLFAVYQNYFDQFKKIKNVSITVQDKTGKKVKKLNRNDGREYGFNPSYEISDGKILVINTDYQMYPYRLIIESHIKLHGFLSLPTWMPRYHFNLSVSHANLTVKQSEKVDLTFRNEHLIPKSEISEEGWKITKYEVGNLPPQDDNIRFKDFYALQPKVLIAPSLFKFDGYEGSMKSWASFGNWFLSLNSHSYTLRDESIVFLDSIKSKDVRERIQTIYKFMQDKTRYISIQLGIGGFKSMPIEDVESYGYGDCKALTTYMKNMLDYSGIKSNYILVKAGKDVPDIIAEFPSNQFNHVYLGIPLDADTVLLECTSQTMPSNYIGTFTDNRNVLWVDKDKSSIIRSRNYTYKDNVKISRLNIKIDDDGNAAVINKIENSGIFFDEILLFKSGREDYIQQYNENKFNYKDATLNNFEFNQPSRDRASFISKYEFSVNGLAKKWGDRLIMPLNVSSSVRDFVDKDDFKKYVHVQRGMTIRDTIDIQLPEKYRINNLPENASLTSEFGSYELSVQQHGSSFQVYKTITIYSGDYVEDNFFRIKEFLDEIEKIENQKLVLNSKT